MLAYYGYQQGPIFYEETGHILHNSISINKQSLSTNHDFSADAKNLKKIMRNDKPYLAPTLTVHELADKINIPSHQLSKIIHKEYLGRESRIIYKTN